MASLSPSGRDRRLGWSLVALVAVLACAAALRAHQIGRESVWIDEALSVRLASLPLRALGAATAEDGHPPLYLALLHGWMKLFGTSEAAIRSLSAALGVAGAAAMYLLGRALYGDRTGLMGAALVAFSPYHIYYSQEARNYSLLALVTVVSHLAFVRLRTAGAPRAAVLYVLSALLVAYTHVFGLFVWAAHLLVLVLSSHREPPRGRRVLWLAQLAVAVGLVPWAFSPWAARLATQASPVTTALRLAKPDAGMVVGAFAGYSGSALGLLLTAPWAAAEVIRALRLRRGTASASLEAPRRLDDREAALLLTAAVVVPHAIPFLYSQIRVPVYIARATIVALPPYFLLAAAAIDRRPRLLRGVALGAILVSALGSQRAYLHLVSKEQWRDAARDLDAEAASGDVVAFDPGYGQEGFDYYSRRADVRKARLGAELGTPRARDELAAARGGASRVWVVRLHRPRDEAAVARSVGPDDRLAGSGHYAGIDLYLYERRPPPRPSPSP